MSRQESDAVLYKTEEKVGAMPMNDAIDVPPAKDLLEVHSQISEAMSMCVDHYVRVRLHGRQASSIGGFATHLAISVLLGGLTALFLRVIGL